MNLFLILLSVLFCCVIVLLEKRIEHLEEAIMLVCEKIKELHGEDK